MGNLGDVAVPSAIDGGDAPRWQLNLALRLPFQKQTAAGHVLDLARGIAPVPGQTEFARESCAMGGGMGGQPTSNQRDILAAHPTPLDNLFSVHSAKK